jgi:hypothetical protein
MEIKQRERHFELLQPAAAKLEEFKKGIAEPGLS